MGTDTGTSEARVKLCVVSGKGGTGKTTLSVGLAMALAAGDGDPVTLLDCDVEEPNVHLYLRPSQVQLSQVQVPVPEWDAARCNACGACRRACAFGALALFGDRLEIFPEHCHSCGACFYVCPQQALREIPRSTGTLHQGQAGVLKVIWGELSVGEPRPVPVIEAVRAAAKGSARVIIDGPPGTSCALVATASEADVALVVTEPTPFGRHDLEAALEVLKELGVPAAVALNKSEVADGGIHNLCLAMGVPLLLEIPFDPRLAELGAAAIPLSEVEPAWGPVLMELWLELEYLATTRGAA